VVFGQNKAGERVPMIVTVAPVHDESGQVIGGVESFKDFTDSYNDLKLAQRIQRLALENALPQDPRIEFSTFYVPHDMIGGDFFSIRQLDADRYGFLLADVMGHGISAALHTMHLNSLWARHCDKLIQPAAFAQAVNQSLCQVVKDESFATAICGVIDAATKTVRLASAGGPPAVLSQADGQSRQLALTGLPLGILAPTKYVETEFRCAVGDHLLMFTDGAIEIHNANRQILSTAGLMNILDKLGYPRAPLQIETLQKELLNFSDGIRLEDDLTLIDVWLS
jgi:serine phosphatase RsbU (regulator of sigma subunit)